jgi:hypothetical protein
MRFAANSLGACEAGVLLAEINAPPYGDQPPWQVVAQRDLEQFAALGDRMTGEHAEKLAQLRERLASLPGRIGLNP